MIIQANNTIYKYSGSQILDLMKAPSPDSNRQLYNDYYNFIKSIDAIYGTQDSLGSIPVFRTKLSSGSEDLEPDPDSTLKYLIPNESYLFIVNSDSYLPLKIPNPIGFEDFVTKSSKVDKSTITCCPFINIESSVNLDESTGNTYIIRAKISDMLSNEKYFYEITPIFSNWPAQLSVVSGEIIAPEEPDSEGKTESHIESVFSYYQYLTENLDKSIPYSINKSVNNEFYNQNIFTLLNLKIFNTKCSIYDKNITIKCNACVKNNICPKVNLISQGSNETRYITASLSNLEHDVQYRYEFTTNSSNLRSRISPVSGTLPKGKDQTSATLYSVFKFCDDFDDDCNLSPTLTNSYSDPAVSAKIYTNLVFNLYPIAETYCDPVSSSTLIECNKCFDTNNFRTSITFARPEYRESGLVSQEYPTLGPGLVANSNAFFDLLDRPNLEYNLYTSGLNSPCCDKPATLKLLIKDAIPGDKYTYDFSSYPEITIIPSTGIISFGNSSGVISVLGYLEGKKSSSIHVALTHEKTNQKASSASIIRCPEAW
jgi:hypothetical protein